MSVTVDTSGFQTALRRHLANTSRTASEVVNMHAAAVLMRAFLSLPPRDPKMQRDNVRAELNQPAKDARENDYKAKHALLRWARRKAGKPPLNSNEFATEARKFGARRTASVGSVKSLLVKMLRKVMPSFTQFGRKKGKRQTKANNMLLGLAKQYGHAATNVGVARNARANGTPATPGWYPTATASGLLGVKPGEEGKVNPMFAAAMARAITDETAEMVRHLEQKLLDDAEQSGFIVR